MKNDILYDKNSTDEALDISCNVCPRKCNVNRKEGTSYCKSKGLRIARLGLHMWEEPCISGKYGSGTIFFSGCSLRCIYCQNYDVSQKSRNSTAPIAAPANDAPPGPAAMYPNANGALPSGVWQAVSAPARKNRIPHRHSRTCSSRSILTTACPS